MPKTDFIADFQMIGSRVENLKINNDFISIDIDNTTETKKSLKLSHNIKAIDIDETNKLTGLVELFVSVKLTREKKKLSVDIALEGCFNADAEMGKDNFEKMLEINGVSALYGVARAIVLSITSQVLVQGNIMLPMINVYNYSENKKEKEKAAREKVNTK